MVEWIKIVDTVWNCPRQLIVVQIAENKLCQGTQSSKYNYHTNHLETQ